MSKNAPSHSVKERDKAFLDLHVYLDSLQNVRGSFPWLTIHPSTKFIKIYLVAFV